MSEDALLRLGWGCRTTGIALIAEHPIVAGANTEGGQYQTNRLALANSPMMERSGYAATSSS